jgi:rubrerythrin
MANEEIDKADHSPEYLVALREAFLAEDLIPNYIKQKIHMSARGVAGGKISGQSRRMLVEAGEPDEIIDEILEEAEEENSEENEEVEKGGFVDPFVGNAKPMNKEDLIRALHLDIAMEYNAASTYTAHADGTNDPIVKQILTDIAAEEIVHIGELQRLVGTLTGHEECSLIHEGKEEINEQLGELEPITNGTETVTKAMTVDIMKYDEEKGLVYGVVLVPDVEDLQGDIISKEEIEKVCHDYNVRSRQVKKQHQGNKREDAAVVESYVYRHHNDVTPGSWIMVTKLNSDELKKGVKSGEITGYSIGGRGSRIPA